VIREQQHHTFQRVYRETHDDLVARLESGVLSPSEFAGMLEALYVQEGNDWLGRGEAEETVLSATIAAFEAVLHSRDELFPASKRR
jgi:hypothetical protein